MAPVLLVGLLLSTACADRAPLGSDDGSTSAHATTTSSDGTGASSAADATGETAAVDSSGGSSAGEPVDCQSPQQIPPPPVDCSGADGVLMGDVVIDDTDMSDDPAILEGVRRVEGSILIERTALTNLDFMACVQEVGATVTIYDNDALTDVDGLWSLTEIGTDFVFSQNDALVDFDGLPNVEVIVGNLIMKENAALEEITGFHRLEILLDTAGPDGELYGGNLTIQQNPVLWHVDGLGGLREVHGVFAVISNPMLCGSSVACVGGGIEVPAEPPPSWPDPYAHC